MFVEGCTEGKVPIILRSTLWMVSVFGTRTAKANKEMRVTRVSQCDIPAPAESQRPNPRFHFNDSNKFWGPQCPRSKVHGTRSAKLFQPDADAHSGMRSAFVLGAGSIQFLQINFLRKMKCFTFMHLNLRTKTMKFPCSYIRQDAIVIFNFMGTRNKWE